MFPVHVRLRTLPGMYSRFIVHRRVLLVLACRETTRRGEPSRKVYVVPAVSRARATLAPRIQRACQRHDFPSPHDVGAQSSGRPASYVDTS